VQHAQAVETMGKEAGIKHLCRVDIFQILQLLSEIVKQELQELIETINCDAMIFMQIVFAAFIAC
jgi:hypothetical protein